MIFEYFFGFHGYIRYWSSTVVPFDRVVNQRCFLHPHGSNSRSFLVNSNRFLDIELAKGDELRINELD